MDNGVLAASIQAGAQMAGSAASASIANAYNMKLARYAADFQRQMIKEQNEYNSPLQQMKRYEDAGLNPNLIYGNGTSSAGNQSEIARYHAPEIQVPELGNVIQAGINFALAKREIALKDQELRNKQEEQFNLRSVRQGIDLDNAEKSVLLDYNPGLVLDVGSKESILNSRKLKSYDLGIQAKEAEVAYTNARKALTNIDARYRQNIIDKFQEKQLELIDKQIAGKDIENEILGVERDLQNDLSKLGGKSGVKIIIDLLRAILK